MKNPYRLQAYLKTVALPKAGLTLGILALGNLWANLLPTAAGGWIRWICGLLALCFFLQIVGKFLWHPQVVFKEDMANPVVAPVSATIYMTLMQFATYLAALGSGGTSSGATATAASGGVDWWHAIALVVWWFAVVSNLLLMVWITYRFVCKAPGLQIQQVFPTWFVGYIGIVVAAATSGTLGVQAVGRPIFWVGFVFYLLLFPLVTYRALRHPLPEPVRPSLAIYTAPASLILVGYATAYSTASMQPNKWFILVLAILAQVFFVVVLAILPRLLRLPFYPSYSALTFPLVITATGLWQTLQVFSAQGTPLPAWLEWVQLAETIFATVIVLYVACRFLGNQSGRWRQAGAEIRQQLLPTNA